MPYAPPTPDPAEDGPEPWERDLLDRQLQRLDRLADLGMDMAAAIARRVTADDGSAPVAELQHAALDFSRVARAVRLTLALQSKLIADFKRRPDQDEESGPVTLKVSWLDSLREPTEATKARAKQAVRRAAEDAHCDAETAERLVLEAAERLEDDDIHAALAERPFDEIVEMICRELGLAPDNPITRPPPLAGEEDPDRGGGGMRQRYGMPPPSLRDSSPASGGARADPERAFGSDTG